MQDTERNTTLIAIDMENMDEVDKQTLQAALDRKATGASAILGKTEVAENVLDTPSGEGLPPSAKPRNTRPLKPSRQRNNYTPPTQEPYMNERVKPSFTDMVAYLIDASPVTCIGESLYFFQHISGHYKALSLQDGTFQRHVLGFCPVWFKSEHHTNMNGRIYSDMVIVIQKHYSGRWFDDEDMEFTRQSYILTSDSIYETDTGIMQKGVAGEIPFVRKGLGVWLLPHIEQKDLQYRKHFDSFLEAASNGSERVKNHILGLLGCLFANSEYNEKKIVILYGHKTTIRAIIKFFENCMSAIVKTFSFR